MKPASAAPYAGKGILGTEVPNAHADFVWHEETIRTICAKGRFRQT